MMKKIAWFNENKLIAAGFSLALLLTGSIGLISYHNATELIESAAKVNRTDKIFSNLTDLMSILVDAESGRRGYLLFKDTTELQRYQAATSKLNPKITQLQQWIDPPTEQQKFAHLKELISQRLSLSEQSIALDPKDVTARLKQAELLAKNQNNRREIQQIIDRMRSDREQSLQQSVDRFQANTHYRIAIEIISTLLGFGILLGMFGLVYQQMLKRYQAESHQQALVQAQELSELKLRFFSMVSHEFRTPLSIILGSAQLLADDDLQWTQEKKLTNLERIQSSARSMNQLLTDILTLTRAEAGKLEFNPTLIDVETFCINLIEDMKLCCEPNQNLKFTSDTYCPHAQLDEKLLYSMLSNLISNALKYSPESGTVEFVLKYEADTNIFQVKDRGIGIPIEAQSNLYEPFCRANNVETISGTGLGLAVVKKCVDLHQGEIMVDSKVGEGTTFTVKIPQEISRSNC